MTVTGRRLDPDQPAPADLMDTLAREARPTRRGGWPGPAKAKWSFRPTEATEATVAAYIKVHDLDPERGRSQAINALIAGTADPLPETGV